MPWPKGRSQSEKHRAKISTRLKGRRFSPHTREALRVAAISSPLAIAHRQELHTDPVLVRRRLDRLAAAKALPEARRSASERFLALYTDPEFRRKHQEGVDRMKADPEWQRKSREHLDQLHSDRVVIEQTRSKLIARAATETGRTQLIEARRVASRAGRIGSRAERMLVPFVQLLGGRWNGQGQAGVFVAGRFLPDFVWPERKLALEVDGRHWHHQRANHDAERDRVFAELGWKVLRVDAEGVERTRDAVRSRIRAFVGA
jgi:very-short-patch-repair endonuclease